MKYSLILIFALLFALNLGGGNFAASFVAARGGGIISHLKSSILFLIFAVAGAVILGGPVTRTLSREIVASRWIDLDVCLVILIAATGSLFAANRLQLPQSSSLVTVGAIVGAGLYLGKVNFRVFAYLLPFWILLPVAGFFLTRTLGRMIYPPRKGNFWIYEKVVSHRKRLKTFVILASCYNAFACGSNNVANVVGPLAGAQIVSPLLGLALLAPIFGLGGLVFPGMLKTAAEKIVPLGLLTATLLCLVSGTLMLLSSSLGIPQSFVMVKMSSLFAIGSLKAEDRAIWKNPLIVKTSLAWVVMPVIATVVSYLLIGGWRALSA
ncbi:MAG TPA: hypothetical protein ENH12_04170 [Proteobacteria bacterium]|nr:hypothetical protein [Pseudomonadota bacterium]